MDFTFSYPEIIQLISTLIVLIGVYYKLEIKIDRLNGKVDKNHEKINQILEFERKIKELEYINIRNGRGNKINPAE